MPEEKKLTGYPSIDKPWKKYYENTTPSIPLPETSMYAFLLENSKTNPDRTALNYYGRKINYRVLIEKIDAVASALRSIGVHKGDIVSLCALNIPEFFYLLYALNKIGAISNWVGLTSPIADLHEQLASTNSRIVFTINIAYPQIEKAAQNTKVEEIISIPIETSMPAFMKKAVSFKNRHLKNAGTPWKKFISAAAGNTEEAVMLPNDVAVIEYTGGSTGVPKGVMLSNKAMNSHYVIFLTTNSSGITNFGETEIVLCGVPLFLVFGICACCHGPLCHGMELVLAPDPSPDASVKIIMQSKVNHIIAGKPLINKLAEMAQNTKADLSFIRSIMYGGEETNKTWENSVRNELKKYHLNAPILNSYGMSETSAGVLTAPDDETDGLIPCAGVNVKIANPDNCNEEYGYGEEGELCISTEKMMLGYYNKPEETKDVFFEENGVRWLKTHDLAVIFPDGIIKITGRIKRIFYKLNSDNIPLRVYPMRIEEAIEKCDNVEKSAVIGVKDAVMAYRTIAYIILSDNATDADEVRKQLEAYCHSNLPENHWPDDYVFVESFPITRAGKVDYRALEKRAEEMQQS